MINKYKGNWYLPHKKEIKIGGVLTIDTAKSIIELVLFSEINFLGETLIHERNSNHVLYPEIVHGNVFNFPKEISLFSDGGSPVSFESINEKQYKLIYRPSFAFIGIYFENRDSIKFSNISFSYTYLNYWIDGIHNFYKRIDDNSGLTIKYIKNSPFEIEVNNEYKLSVYRECWSEGEYTRKHEMLVKHFTSFSFHNPHDLYEFLRLSEKIQYFLLFALAKPVQLTESYSKIDECNRVEIYSNFTKSETDDYFLNVNDIPLGTRVYTDEQLKEFILKWFSLYDTFQSAFDTFYHAVKPSWSKGFSHQSNIEFTNGILNIVQSIETFFKKDNNIDYKKIRENFTLKRNPIFGKIERNKDLINLSEDDINFLNRYFKLPKEKDDYSLQEIILQYLNTLEGALDGFMLRSDFESFSKNLKDCRNALSHINHKNSIDISKEFDLPHLFYYSQILFYSIVLNKLNIQNTEINKILKRIKHYKHLIKR